MSYVTYTTEALVCGASNLNTADRAFRLFTREAGMLYASAKSVREERSRQRYALQEFSQVRLSLVKGKQYWKIGSVEVTLNDYTRANSREARGSVVMIYRFLRRFIHGEEPSVKLFNFCLEALSILTQEISHRSELESYTLVRILIELGYLSEETLPKILKGIPITEVAKIITTEQGRELQKSIVTATLNSQL